MGIKENVEKIKEGVGVDSKVEKMLGEITEDTAKYELWDMLEPLIAELATWNDYGKAMAFLKYKIAVKFGLKSNDLKSYGGKLKKLHARHEKEQENKAPELTKKEKEQALNFLKSPDLIKLISQDLDKVGHVGEKMNKMALYLVASSRKQDSPLSNTIKGPSSAGKNALVNVVMSLMPEEDVIFRTRMTPQAMAYLEKTAWKHKWVIVAEIQGTDSSIYNLRVMLSEKGLSTEIPVKDESTGKFETETVEVEGPLAFTVTTTKISIDSETENRMIDLYIDTSADQTERILKAQREAVTLDGLKAKKGVSEIKKLHQNAQRLLEPVKVVVNYAYLIKFPTAQIRVRRDQNKFLELIKIVAFLRQFQKQKKVYRLDGEKIEYVEADLYDYEVAYYLAGEVFRRTLDELHPNSRELLINIQKMLIDRFISNERKKQVEDYIERDFKDQPRDILEAERQRMYRSLIGDADKGFVYTRKDIRRYTGYSEKYIKDYIKQLEELEYLPVSDKAKGRAIKYTPVSLFENFVSPEFKGLTTPEELRKKLDKKQKD